MSVDSADDGDPAAQNQTNQAGRKHRRRGKSKKKKWKPYYKLTAQERRDLEENEGRRADKVRAQRFAHGQPVAPYNTTQFLMEDHDVKEPDLDRVHSNNTQRQSHVVSHELLSNKASNRRSSPMVTKDNEDDHYYYSSPDDEGDFLQKEFSEDYKNAHAERLNSMSKGELVQEYLQLEDRVEKLERELTELRSCMNENSSRCPSRGTSIFLPIDIQSSSRCSSVDSEGSSRELRPINDAIS